MGAWRSSVWERRDCVVSDGGLAKNAICVRGPCGIRTKTVSGVDDFSQTCSLKQRYGCARLKKEIWVRTVEK